MHVDGLEQEIDELLPEVIALRRDLHRNPETAFEEVRTAQRLLEWMGDLGEARVETGIARTGMLITFAAEASGPCVALRADMDALPITEETGLPWASTVAGKMHACGHDGHSAMLAAAARILARHQRRLQGPVKLIFQPAEEGGGGGALMREAGVLDNPRVAAVFGLHNNLPGPDHKIGSIAYTPGPAMAGTGSFEIIVHGKGGHAAFPHLCTDPLLIAAQLVNQLQALVARRTDPLQAAVLSVTRFHAGSANNIIPQSAVLGGTFRALDIEVLRQLHAGIKEMSHAVCHAHGACADVRCELGYPVLANHPAAEACFRRILRAVAEPLPLVRVAPIMGGEDFAYFAEAVPGFFYFLPACPADKEAIPMCHHPAYDFNDDLLPAGIRLHLQTAFHFASTWQPLAT